MTMDDKTLMALNESIAKWEYNAAIDDIEYATISVGDCPLCTLFFHRNCGGCPVSERTGENLCYDTPYMEASKARSFDNLLAFKESAADEVEFLKSLLPTEET